MCRFRACLCAICSTLEDLIWAPSSSGEELPFFPQHREKAVVVELHQVSWEEGRR
jgi:hypothetical protein